MWNIKAIFVAIGMKSVVSVGFFWNGNSCMGNEIILTTEEVLLDAHTYSQMKRV